MKKVTAKDFRNSVLKAYVEWSQVRNEEMKLSNKITRASAFNVAPHQLLQDLKSLELREEELRWDVLLLVGGLLDQQDPRSNLRARQRMNYLLGRWPKRDKRRRIVIELGAALEKKKK